jgi:hypothetical protein
MNGSGINYIAKWNGTIWSALGTGTELIDLKYDDYVVKSLAIDSNNNLYVCGFFKMTIGTTTTYNIAKWDGTTWSNLGDGLPTKDLNTVFCLAIDSNNNVYAGVNDDNTGNIYVYKWNGIAWTALSSGMPLSGIASIVIDLANNIYVAGFRSVIFGSTGSLLKWNGTGWSLLATSKSNSNSISRIFALALEPGGTNIYVGGSFATIGDISANNIAKYNTITNTWNNLSTGANNSVNALALDSQNNVYAGGNFTSMGGLTNANRLAKWNGTIWSALGSGANNTVQTIIINKSNNIIYAGGDFTSVGDVTNTNRIAKWNGVDIF